MQAWLEQLHRGAQWYAVPASERTGLQRLAARTLGIVTLSNAATVLGALLAVWGMVLFYQKAYAAGILLVGGGRCFDLLDGFLARKTKTSSPFGEGLDAGFDKLIIFIAAVFLTVMQVLPVGIGALFLLEQLTTAIVTLAARRHEITLHPTRLGKYTTFGIWVSIGLYLTAYWLRHDGMHTSTLGLTLYIVSTLLALCIIMMRLLALARYLSMIRRSSQAKSRQRG